MKVLIIVNPRSGNIEQEDLASLISKESERTVFKDTIFSMPANSADQDFRMTNYHLVSQLSIDTLDHHPIPTSISSV